MRLRMPSISSSQKIFEQDNAQLYTVFKRVNLKGLLSKNLLLNFGKSLSLGHSQLLAHLQMAHLYTHNSNKRMLGEHIYPMNLQYMQIQYIYIYMYAHPLTHSTLLYA